MREQNWSRWSGIGLFLVAFGAALWGTDAVLRQPLTNEMSSTAIVFAEHLFLAIYAIPILLTARGFFSKLTRTGWIGLLIISWGGSGLATVLFTEAFKQGNPTTVILLQKTQPLIVVLLASLFLKERLSRFYWPCFAVAAIGAYLVSFGTLDPFWTLGDAQVTAAVFALGAAALWGGSTVMGRFLLGGAPFQTVTAARFLFALPFLAGLAFVKGDFTSTFTGIANDPVRVFLLALIPGLIAMLIYYRGLSQSQASYATLAELAYPATAAIVNWVFLDAGITGTQIVGFVLLWSAITALSWLSSLQPVPREAAAAAG